MIQLLLCSSYTNSCRSCQESLSRSRCTGMCRENGVFGRFLITLPTPKGHSRFECSGSPGDSKVLCPAMIKASRQRALMPIQCLGQRILKSFGRYGYRLFPYLATCRKKPGCELESRAITDSLYARWLSSLQVTWLITYGSFESGIFNHPRRSPSQCRACLPPAGSNLLIASESTLACTTYNPRPLVRGQSPPTRSIHSIPTSDPASDPS